VAHTRRDFFEELNADIEIDAPLLAEIEKSMVNDELPFPWATRPGLSWSRAFSAPELAALEE